MATSAVTVMTLRSRLDRPGRSHISPNSTFSVKSASFGATSPILSLVVGSGLSFVIDSPDSPLSPLVKAVQHPQTVTLAKHPRKPSIEGWPPPDKSYRSVAFCGWRRMTALILGLDCQISPTAKRESGKLPQ